MKLQLALFAALMLVGCGAPPDMGKATTAVADFHRLQAAGDDAGIYQAASQGFRDGASLSDLQRIDGVVRAAITRGCGPAPTSPTSWNSFYSTGGSRVTLQYNRTCSGGPLRETFVFVMDGKEPKLFSYNADGLALFPPANAPDTATPPTAPAPDVNTKPTLPLTTSGTPT